MLFSMIVIGGVTRLTGSGLSMVEWAPITGWLPPLSEDAWQRVFSLYRQSPQYESVNVGMDLAGFKSIFWLEYFHRLLGRAIGLTFALPGLYFLLRGKIHRRLGRGLLGLVLLVGVQGVVGWLMVASGLVDLPHVSHYRLTLHLGLGFVIFGWAFWVALRESLPVREEPAVSSGFRRMATSFTALAGLTVLSGGLVAGLRAGHAFPTFPLMGGRWIPVGLGAASPWWRNFIDNVVTVQFQHRLLATSVAIFALIIVWRARRLPRGVRSATWLLLLAVGAQVTLGITTLLWHVPVVLASLHQANAALLIAAALHLSYRLRVVAEAASPVPNATLEPALPEAPAE